MSHANRVEPPVSFLRRMLSGLRLDVLWSRFGQRPDPVDRPAGRPAERPESRDMARERVRAQVRVIRDALGEDQVAAGPGDGTERAEDADAAYLFRPGHALVRLDRTEEFFAFFSDPERRDSFLDEPRRAERQSLEQLVVFEMPERADGRDSVLATLAEMDDAVRPDPERGPLASPDHLLYVVTVNRFCPYTEPEEPATDQPVPTFNADPDAGNGVKVAVVDTGWWPEAAKHNDWLASGVYANAKDEEHINQLAIHEYAGHGTFVAGVVRRAAPMAQVQVEGAFTQGGAVSEADIVLQLHQAFTETQDAQLISISAGTHTRGDFALIGFDVLADALGLQGGKTLVIAAAGNDSSTAPFWPAAFPWARGVGAVNADGKVAKYSNTGDWVDVYARGTDHVNAFPVGTYPCYEPANAGQVRQFRGLAKWSGTSFATPVVTGLVAAEMSRNPGMDPLKAFENVKNGGTNGNDPAGLPIKVVGPLI